MSHIVLIGTAKKPYKLRVRDLPADHDLSYSYWRWVDFSGFDLSAYSMENMDTIDCQAQNVILPDGGRTDYLISRWTDWTGATIPPDLSSYHHDILREAIRQMIPRLKDNALKTAQIIVPMQADYRNSWVNIIQAVADQLHLTTPGELLAVGGPIFVDYPRIMGRLSYHLGSNYFHPQAPDLRQDLTKVDWRIGAETVCENIDREVRGTLLNYDRWAAARMVEQLLTTRRDAPVAAYFAQLHPEPVLFVAGSDFPLETDWWQLRWPA